MCRSKSRSGASLRWSALTRQRPHQLVDLLLGAFLLAGVAIGIGSLSPILAAVLVLAIIGVYLDGLLRQERARQRRADTRVGSRAEAD